jgi:tetratricopeptide (TPR) repeat protein
MHFDTQSTQNGFAWLDDAVKRLQQGEAAVLIEETLRALTHDEKNTQLLQIVSMAYTYQGQGEQAEPYARQALGLISKDKRSSPLRVEMAHVCLYDSLIAQGRFAEASKNLDVIVRRVPHTNAVLLLIAWGYFLAGDMKNVRRAFAREVPPGPDTTGSDEIARIFPSYTLMEFYIQYALNIYPPHPAAPMYPVPPAVKLFLESAMTYMTQSSANNMMPFLTRYLAKWEDEARRHAHNPYGTHLSEILEKVRKLEWYTEYNDRLLEAIRWREM